jgi:hypothetical protein
LNSDLKTCLLTSRRHGFALRCLSRTAGAIIISPPPTGKGNEQAALRQGVRPAIVLRLKNAALKIFFAKLPKKSIIAIDYYWFYVFNYTKIIGWRLPATKRAPKSAVYLLKLHSER